MKKITLFSGRFFCVFALCFTCFFPADDVYGQSNRRRKRRNPSRREVVNYSKKKPKKSLSQNDLLRYIRSGENLYASLTPENLFKTPSFLPGKFFNWTSSRKDSARYYPGKRQKKRLTFANVDFAEAIISFERGKFKKLYISLFNEGDNTGKTYSKNSFDRLQEDLEEYISNHLQKTPEESKQRIRKMASLRILNWSLEKYTLKLVVSGSKNPLGGPSYCYVELVTEEDNTQRKNAAKVRSFRNRGNRNSNGVILSTKIKKGELIKNVIKESGKVWINNIPMVDQGPKGYCVPSVLERVMGYYGVSVNQHIFAGMMDTRSTEGTSLSNMYMVLRKCSKKLNVNIRRQYESFRTVSDVEKFVSRYNSLAGKQKMDKIKIVKFGERLDVAKTLLAADPQVAREALQYLKRKGYKKTFCEFVKENIDAGIPVLWSVILDFSPEKNVTRGGHLRLIIGYEKASSLSLQSRNRRKKADSDTLSSIIFSDTWGRGHEAKYMAGNDAWAITTGLYFVEPDN